MVRRFLRVAAAAALLPSAHAFAAPGQGNEVYGATADKGELELEVTRDILSGGPDAGEAVYNFEAEYGLTDRLRVGVQNEFEREPGGKAEFEALGIEAIYELGKIGPFDAAVYGEYEIEFEGPDKVETKFILQHARGPFDFRLNLIAERELAGGSPVELEYAASADVAAVGELRIGAQAFGELGTFGHFLPRAEHFVGPAAKLEIEGLGPELEITTGYLFALGAAKDDTDGQFRLALELEF